ncbi:SDR family oxidoreductase [Mesorhizobium sp. CA18]|uniref:SDR family NAD(P)-dependent oxidoreductase n=1 Tax=unclassified Mesorhizobium TaxID=325217 RepID=UPI001CCCEA86|nr:MULTISPECIES: SDR family oxidoreductase [unclassified Mesorhizobium]MBZ9736170.1 SDR family oxidoreductase [Mesorhizobium sp. CA9]MBZ9827934.1 SDR family oxidoreductase [Mesorhizobium sp. CA18]MBZ9833740.1 SDR family oxidoreductase [Mesorhizobium sp. CA2]MBZ9839953.1 SDR family oxidoreductase [Mesorhizobium sp. CA3]MBZ9879913.1 SDR family oxidoreductase [Mesorhizobium sp. Ca11]
MTTRPIALITGGSRGLGRNTAIHLARRGVDVIVTYRSRADEAKSAIAEIEAAGGRAAALELDAGAVASFPAFIAALKKTLKDTWQRDRFDYLVNNAGTGLRKMIAETTEEEFDTLMNTHLKGVFFLTQALLPLINDGGRIINISSGLARFAAPGSSAYAMMKGGIEVFTRYLAKELGRRGITANTVAPGAIATDFNGGHVRDNAEINRMVAGVTALGRVGVPDDIGPMIASLLSDDNRWVNAQRIEVSGGMNI